MTLNSELLRIPARIMSSTPPPAIQAIHCWAWLFSTLKENKSAYGCLLAAPHKQKISSKEYGYLIRIDDTPKMFENSKVSKDWLRGSSLTLPKREFATKAAFKKLFLLEPPCIRQDEKKTLSTDLFRNQQRILSSPHVHYAPKGACRVQKSTPFHAL